MKVLKSLALSFVLLSSIHAHAMRSTSIIFLSTLDQVDPTYTQNKKTDQETGSFTPSMDDQTLQRYAHDLFPEKTDEIDHFFSLTPSERQEMLNADGSDVTVAMRSSSGVILAATDRDDSNKKHDLDY